MKNLIDTHLNLICAAMLTLSLVTSCYRMPGPDDYSVVPTTNNPDVIGKSCSNNWMPGAGF